MLDLVFVGIVNWGELKSFGVGNSLAGFFPRSTFSKSFACFPHNPFGSNGFSGSKSERINFFILFNPLTLLIVLKENASGGVGKCNFQLPSSGQSVN